MNERKICDICSTSMCSQNSWRFICPECGFLSSNLESGAGADIGGLENLRRHNFKILADRIEQHIDIAGRRLLEIGCAKGWFLQEMIARGAIATGIEPDPAAAKLASQTGAKVINAFFPTEFEQKVDYDIIVFNDVFEHLVDPGSVIKAVSEALAPGGLVVFNLPNSTGILYQIAKIAEKLGYKVPMDRLWQKGLQSPHISYFSATTLQRLVTNTSSFRLVESFPLKTIATKSLFARIHSTHGLLTSLVLMPPLIILSLLQNILPSDILAMIYKGD